MIYGKICGMRYLHHLLTTKYLAKEVITTDYAVKVLQYLIHHVPCDAYVEHDNKTHGYDGIVIKFIDDEMQYWQYCFNFTRKWITMFRRNTLSGIQEITKIIHYEPYKYNLKQKLRTKLTDEEKCWLILHGVKL